MEEATGYTDRQNFKSYYQLNFRSTFLQSRETELPHYALRMSTNFLKIPATAVRLFLGVSCFARLATVSGMCTAGRVHNKCTMYTM